MRDKIKYLLQQTFFNLVNFGFLYTLKRIFKYIKKVKFKIFSSIENNDKLIFFTEIKLLKSYSTFKRKFKPFYIYNSIFHFSDLNNNDHNYQRFLIISEDKFINDAINLKLKNYKSYLILITKIKEYNKISIKKRPVIDFLIFLDKDDQISNFDIFSGFYFSSKKNISLVIDKIVQIFFKKECSLIPIIPSNNPYVYELHSPKTIFIEFKKIDNKLQNNFNNTFNDIINEINIQNIEFLYVTEDLYWLYNHFLQNVIFTNDNLKQFLKYSLNNGCLVKSLPN